MLQTCCRLIRERVHREYELDNVTPADVYFGRKYQIITKREKIKNRTMCNRRKEYLACKAASERTKNYLLAEAVHCPG